MGHVRRFRKCETCGEYGHGGRKCPLFELNQQQEREHRCRVRDAALGLTPDLEKQIERIRSNWRIGLSLACILLCCGISFAGTITGSLQTATGGSVANGTLSFRLSQPAVLSGTASLVTSPTSCYTSSAGNIVGLPDPLVLPLFSTNTASGTLAAGTYYVVYAYTGAGGTTMFSPEVPVTLSAQGTITVFPPVLQPPAATGYKVYISTTSGAETLQGTVTGFGSYAQTSALSAGAPLGSEGYRRVRTGPGSRRRVPPEAARNGGPPSTKC
jgi:hypothetical protein